MIFDSESMLVEEAILDEPDFVYGFAYQDLFIGGADAIWSDFNQLDLGLGFIKRFV